MSKLTVIVLIALMIVGTVLAIHENQVYDDNIDGYSGQYGRERRIYDPYTRARYFGYDYQRNFFNFGAKGPTNRIDNTGAKSAYSGVFNLDTNTFSNRGRDPSFISNFDPEIRGFARLDRYVELLPYSVVGLSANDQPILAQGTARILSTGDQYGNTLNKPYPRTQVFVQAINLPPLGVDKVYEVWLYNDAAEYALSVGIMKSGIGLTSQLLFEIRRKVEMFDSVMITEEDYPDIDPGPGKIVLMGSILDTRTSTSVDPVGFERLR